MRATKPKDIEKTLLKKGFKVDEDNHHKYYQLYKDGKKTDIYTYLSHGKSSEDYWVKLMQAIKKQLRFTDTKLAEKFLDCPMTQLEYIEMLEKAEAI